MVKFAGTSEECSAWQDEIDGPLSEDDGKCPTAMLKSQDVGKENKVYFLFCLWTSKHGAMLFTAMYTP